MKLGATRGVAAARGRKAAAAGASWMDANNAMAAGSSCDTNRRTSHAAASIQPAAGALSELYDTRCSSCARAPRASAGSGSTSAQ